MNNKIWVLLISIFTFNLAGNAQIIYPGVKPNQATVNISKDKIYALTNNTISYQFKLLNQKLVPLSFEDVAAHDQLNLANLPIFELELPGNKILSSSNFLVVGNTISVVNESSKGKKLIAELSNSSTGIHIQWTAVLNDDANYLRQIITVSSKNAVKINRISLVKLPLSIGLKREGTVDGSPFVHHNMFFALEHPMSQISSNQTYMYTSLERLNPVTNSSPFTISAVWGTTPKDQLRRGFLYYTEKERANPYHQMLHYNSWFDISYGTIKLNETICLDRIKTYGDSLVEKRHVKMNAFLFDDGWDDNKTLWQFNPSFPNGFSNLRKASAAYNAGIGVWISPWGGYNEPKDQRLAYGKAQKPPFETNENGFSLSGPVYNKRFSSVTSDFIKNYQVSMFKFDGVGAGNGASGASLKYQKDIEALLQLITNMREIKSDLYFSLTVGTWPSVYWLKYGDAIWRAGEDTGLDGEGPKRQQWITYRDGQTYKNIVKRAPLYPLNSIMYHGITIADHGLPDSLEMDNKNIADEIWSFFGTGTNLQELYINPHKLNSTNWDCLSEAANWAKSNEAILADVHWIGGDPSKGEVYGFAAWQDGKGTVTLRNPTSVTQSFGCSVQTAFEIPAGKSVNYVFNDAKSLTHSKVTEGSEIKIELKPFQVIVLNGVEK
ncbi:MAG: hypothetical protein ACRYFA_09375 [Janthinobacterium lividum]